MALVDGRQRSLRCTSRRISFHEHRVAYSEHGPALRFPAEGDRAKVAQCPGCGVVRAVSSACRIGCLDLGRKDVLSTFFGLLSLLAYVRYARRRDLWSLAVCFLLFVCSLLAKQTLVTLPFVFMLLDYWPLHRLSLSRLGSSTADDAAPEPETRAGATSPRVSGAARLLLEKVPFLIVSAAFSVVALAAQSANSAVQTFTTLPLPIRLANAAVAYVGYLEKTFYPHDLAVYYPHPGNQLGWPAVCVAAALIVAISACAIVWSRRHPYLFVGWAWYLGTLVPMLGIIQVGGQQMADRYTYFPLIGVFIAVVWTVRALISELVPAGTLRSRMLGAAALVILAALAATTCWQVACWHDDMTLLTHAIASADDNWFIRNKLGCTLLSKGRRGRRSNSLNWQPGWNRRQSTPSTISAHHATRRVRPGDRPLPGCAGDQ